MGAINKPIRLAILLHAVLMRAIFKTKLFAQQDLNFRDVNLLRKKKKVTVAWQIIGGSPQIRKSWGNELD